MGQYSYVLQRYFLFKGVEYMTKYTHILWDWNGTLIDDAAWNLSRVNIMLKKRGLPVLGSLEIYRSIFGFPVIDYYSRAGFDMEKEPFELLASEFIALYYDEDGSIPLFPGAEDTLKKIGLAGIRQVILSASESNLLFKQVKSYGIEKYFDEIIGIEDIYAAGKIERGRFYIKRAKPARAVLIGDTSHDKETADAMGTDLIFIGRGHHDKNTLLSCGAPVTDDFEGVLALLEIT